MDLIERGDAVLAFLPAIRGLLREGERVRAAIEGFRPDSVAVTLGAEDLRALEAFTGGDEPPANWEEEMYVVGLSQWGDVRKPPPCYLEAVRTATGLGVPLLPLDFDDEAYTERYVECVTTWDLIGHSRVQKRVAKHPFVATTPEEFVLEFDEIVNDPEGYAELEKARERFIALRLKKLLGKHRRPLAVVEFERARGIRALLD